MATYKELSDLELITLVKADNEGAFGEIYHRYKAALYIHAFNLLRDREESKDVLQQVFTTLWTNRKGFELRSHLSGYLYTAVRNTIFKIIAHKEVESKYISSIANFMSKQECITDYRVREEMLAAIIEKEIAELPDKMREVFELSRKENLTLKQIAVTLNISEKTVKNQINNALKILKPKLGVLIYLSLFAGQ